MRGAAEQCDDGNTTNLDGCDASCKFEQVQPDDGLQGRVRALDTCPKDALGEAIVGNDGFGILGSRTQITQAIDNGIKDGSITVEMSFLNLDDLTGTADAALQVGILGGSPAASSATYDGTSDLDWWYATDPATINASRVAVKKLNGSISGRSLSAGPGEILVTVSFVGVAVTMDIFHATLSVGVNSSSALTASTGMSPGHLASEHDASTLTSFATTGTAGTTTGCNGFGGSCRCFVATANAGSPATCPSGELCGVTTARSLYNVAMPSALTGISCGNVFSTANRMIDVFIAGCKGAGIIPEVNVTQPDVGLDSAGNITTDKYVFTPGANKKVELGTCTKNGVADTLADCLDHAGYSSLFQFTSDRVIAK